MSENTDAKPVINVTPLIDVLLVLLIIFMLIAPLKPASFKANIPSEPKVEGGEPHPLTLVVSVNPDYSLNINNKKDFGTVADPSNLIGKLSEIFKERTENNVFRNDSNEVEKTVFIKATRNLPYGEVAKVIDAVKLAGASPIGLQIDKLD